MNGRAITLFAIGLLGYPALVSAQQMRVLFSDSLENHADMLKVTTTGFEPRGNKYGTMKIGAIRLGDLKKGAEVDTLSFSQSVRKDPLMALFDKQHSLIGNSSKSLLTRAEFLVEERISFELTNHADFKTTVTSMRKTVKRLNQAISQGGTFSTSQIIPDTSYVEAWIDIGETEPCQAVLVFQGDEAPDISGVVVWGNDTLVVSSVNKAKKYRASGVELAHANRAIAGLQLPDMHIGPSFILVDKNLPGPLKKISYSLLALVLYVNENRQ
jgi:hypothetical protein